MTTLYLPKNLFRSGVFAHGAPSVLHYATILLSTLILVAAPTGALTQTAETNVSGLIDPVSIYVVESPDSGETLTVVTSEEHLSSDSGNSTHGENITILLDDGIELVMVRIPAGSFFRGAPQDERGRLVDEGPQAFVTISRDFYMGKYEVTQAQWEAIMGNNPSEFAGHPNNPVERISWNDAQSFITALNEHITLTGQGPATMRLPTEAEWEYAARAGTTTRFSFGDSLIGESDGDNCEDDGLRSQYMWYCGNSNWQTQPVGQKLPNPFGLYDMHGNVWEWCQDWFDTYPDNDATDPIGPSSGWFRTLRGGSWWHTAEVARSAFRNSMHPASRGDYSGFRLAATSPVSSEVRAMILGSEEPNLSADLNDDNQIDAADLYFAILHEK